MVGHQLKGGGQVFASGTNGLVLGVGIMICQLTAAPYRSRYNAKCDCGKTDCWEGKERNNRRSYAAGDSRSLNDWCCEAGADDGLRWCIERHVIKRLACYGSTPR